MQDLVDAHLRWLRATNHAVATVRNRRHSLLLFTDWLHDEHVADLRSLTLETLEAYRLSLYERDSCRGGGLAWGTQAEYLGGVKAFLGWCFFRNLVDRNVGAGLSLPRRPVQLPLAVLSARETEAVLRQCRTTTTLGLRDRAMLEVLYSTGIRRSELAQLTVTDVDRERRVVLVRAGKGQRDRVVPVGGRAIRWVERYLRIGRPRLAHDTSVATLVLTSRGGGLRLNRLSELVHRYIDSAALGKHGSCHLLRHTTATLMLEGGADIRDVQEMLGHANLSTTARYAHVSITRLQRVHALTHPTGGGTRR